MAKNYTLENVLTNSIKVSKKTSYGYGM